MHNLTIAFSTALLLAAAPPPKAGHAAASAAKLTVTSNTFKEGGTMPNSTVFNGFGCSGDNVSPDLSWIGAPAATKSFAVIAYDPDAPTGVGFFHWSLFNIPLASTTLDAGSGAITATTRPVGSVLGYTDFGKSQYGGPCPPPGKPHRYQFTVYALDVEKLDLDSSATGALIRFSIKQHTLAEGTLTGKYGR